MLCTPESGDADIRFVAQTGGGGSDIPGSQVLIENGYAFLVIDGTCRYFVQQKKFGDVRTGTLNAHDQESIWQNLRLADWSEYVGCHEPEIFADGGSSWSFRFNSDTLSTCWQNPIPYDRVKWLVEESRSAIDNLHGSGTPVDGPVRYILVGNPEFAEQAESWPDGQFKNAPLWPLSAPAADLAVELNDAYTATSRRAIDADAQALRAIADSFRAGDIGVSYGGYAPVKDSESNYYQLFLRDALPFENEDGYWEENMVPRP